MRSMGFEKNPLVQLESQEQRQLILGHPTLYSLQMMLTKS